MVDDGGSAFTIQATKREAWALLQEVAPEVAEAVRKARERFGELHSVEIEIKGQRVWPRGKATPDRRQR